MPTVSLSNTGSGPLVRATVQPFVRENLSVRATCVQVRTGAGSVTHETGPRLRADHLIALDSTGGRTFRAAVKDMNGLWTEWGDAVGAATPNFAAGDGAASIGSGVDDDLLLREPSVRFPDLSMGSGETTMFRTVVSSGFYDEVRRAKQTRKRAAFHVVCVDLDADQVALLHRFWRALNGPLTPFLFDYADPITRKEHRYVVRFRDPAIVDSLFDQDRSSMEFGLVELIEQSQGGEL